MSQILPHRAARGQVPSIFYKGTRHAYPMLKNEHGAYSYDEITDKIETLS